MGINENTKLDAFISEDVNKYKGVAVPIKAGLLNRLLIKKYPCKKLHVNPDDEFSMPKIGPSYKIISEYEKKFLDNTRHNEFYYSNQEPIIVEKIHPDGYMILNGHHRWAAALRLGFSNIPVKIVNLTHESDIKQILRNSKHDKRVTMDLDEVVFFNPTHTSILPEKDPIFPFNQLYKDKLRLGIPALFRFLEVNGFDIWVYSSNYYSIDYIKGLFHKYHVNVTGIVTGTEKKNNKAKRTKIDSAMNEKYKYTIHIDNDMVLQIYSKSKDFMDYDINATNDWSSKVIDIIKEIIKDE